MRFVRDHLRLGGHLLVADVQPVGRVRHAASTMRWADEVAHGAEGFEEVCRLYGIHRFGRAALPFLYRLALRDYPKELARRAARSIHRGIRSIAEAEDARRTQDPSGALYAVLLRRAA